MRVMLVNAIAMSVMFITLNPEHSLKKYIIIVFCAALISINSKFN